MNLYKLKIMPIILLAALFCFPSPIYSHWSHPDTYAVPIDRLVTNLQAFENKLPSDHKIDRARIEFQIGRLYSMAYARDTETVEVRQARRKAWTPTINPIEAGLGAKIAKSWQASHGKTKSGIVVELACTFEKELKNITISQSSGNDSLDKDVLTMAASAAKEEHFQTLAESDPKRKDGSGITYEISLDDLLDDGKLTKRLPLEITPYYGIMFSHLFELNAVKKKPGLKPLSKAIIHLQKAVELDPELLLAKLGLAWCTDQSGDKNRARDLYRQVFSSSYQKEKRSELPVFQDPITVECAEYLLKLLDSNTDSSEIRDIHSKTREIYKRMPSAVTPVLIPLTCESRLSALLQRTTVVFDLDGKGARACRQWITPQAGWLVYDKEDSGIVSSGKQLIGGVSFWIFWKNGYEVLSALDDNHDGKLSGAELNHLAIWRDANTDGISQPGEVRSLSCWQITELSCKYTELNKHLFCSRDGVLFENGTYRPSYDVWIDMEP